MSRTIGGKGGHLGFPIGPININRGGGSKMSQQIKGYDWQEKHKFGAGR